MLTLIYALFALLAAGLIVTICAMFSAPDGFEDNLGFHPTQPGSDRDSASISHSAAVR